MKKSKFGMLITTLFMLTLWASGNATAGVFFDNFDDGDTDGWSLSPRGNWSIENGSLRQDRGATGSGEDHVLGLVENLIISDQVIETRVSATGYGGVAFWYQDEGNYISVFVYPSSSGISVFEMIDGQDTLSNYDNHTFHDTWYDLSVDADSTTGELAIFLDDTYLFSHFASTLTSNRTGQSGLTSGNAGASFDDFSIVPEPTTILLFVSGLVGFVWFRKRFSGRNRG